MAAIEFIGSDAKYFSWLKDNENGFVLNTTRRTSKNYYVLHTAKCLHISTTGGLKDGAYTERLYIKVCSNDIAGIKQWLHDNRPNVATSIYECKRCNPSLK